MHQPQSNIIELGSERHDSLASLLILLLAVGVFYLYLKLPFAISSPEVSAMVDASYAGFRARGGAEHPLLLAYNYLLAQIGHSSLQVFPEDILTFSHRALAALGVAFMGWYLLQRFGSLIVAIAGAVTLASSLAYWKGALTMNPHQIALVLFLGALCCVARPSYGFGLGRIRDWLGVILVCSAMLFSRYFVIFLPAFIYASSEFWGQRARFLGAVLLFYGAASAVFLYFYIIGPTELMSATSISGRVIEWIQFQPPEGARLALGGRLEDQPLEVSAKISAIFNSAVWSVIALNGDSVLQLAIWFAMGALALILYSVEATRRDVMTALLIIVPCLAATYLQPQVEAQRYLPICAAFVILAGTFAGFMLASFAGSFRFVGAVALLLVIAPAVGFGNFLQLSGASISTQAERVGSPDSERGRSEWDRLR